MSRRWDGEEQRAFRDVGRYAVDRGARANRIGIVGGNSLESGVVLSWGDVKSVGTTYLLDLVGASRGIARRGRRMRWSERRGYGRATVDVRERRVNGEVAS